MFKKQAGTLARLPHQAKRNFLEYQYFEVIRDIYQTIGKCSLRKFTFSLIDSWWNDLNAIVYDLERLPEESYKELIGVISRLTEARNDLRLARFLFSVEEINPVYRLMLRNRAVLRAHSILRKVLLVWQLQTEIGRDQRSIEPAFEVA
jgi:hypothetical protein